MVLGLSLGKKGKNSKKDGQTGPVLRPSPSLPSLQTQGFQWPETLVDMPAVKASRQSNAAPAPTTNTPFRKGNNPATATTTTTNEVGAIAAMYTQPRPTSSFSRHGTYPQLGPNRSIRRKVAPTFNMMVVGAKGTGKTSLLKLLLDTCEISPSASPEQRAAVDKFIQGSSKRTRALHTASVEILEPRFDRVLLTLIDTPGLDFSVGHELETDRAVSQLVKYIDLQFQDTMGEESKVVRQSKGDQHIHLCIYMIDPDTVVPASQRRARAGLPARTRSQTTFSLHNDEDSDDDSSSGDDYEEDAAAPQHKVQRLTMSPVDIRVIKRLSNRVNVLPVVARGDTLIDSRLHAIKRAVKRDLLNAGVDLGVFSPQEKSTHGDIPPVPRRNVKTASSNGHSSSADKDQDDYGEPSDKEGDDDDRESRPVIRIRTNRARSSSRRRRDDSDEEEAPAVPIPANGTADANAPVVMKKVDLDDLLPFAIVVPESELVVKKKGEKKAAKKAAAGAAPNGTADPAVESPVSPAAPALSDAASRSATPTRSRMEAPPPSSFRNSMASPISPVHAPPTRLPKPIELGKFVRKYRWGTIDVINPDHCDFMALRMTVLNTHLKALKVNTKDVLYEKYRTEKLLARRATRNISDEERKQLLRDLGV